MVQSIIQIVFKFLLFFVIIISIGYVFFRFRLKETNNHQKMSRKRQRTLGLLMELDNISLLAISIICVRFIFLIYMLFNRNDITSLHLYTLLFLSILFGIITRSFKNMILEVGSNTALYFSLISSKVLANYLVEIQFVWYVFLGDALLLLFIGLCMLYFFIRHINDVISRTKYVRRYRSEES